MGRALHREFEPCYLHINFYVFRLLLTGDLHVRWHQGQIYRIKMLVGTYAKVTMPHVIFWLTEDQIFTYMQVVGLQYHILPILGLNLHIDDKL
jgi:hypothetical protein